MSFGVSSHHRCGFFIKGTVIIQTTVPFLYMLGISGSADFWVSVISLKVSTIFLKVTFTVLKVTFRVCIKE